MAMCAGCLCTSMADDPAIGIHVGNNRSMVSVYWNRECHIICNDEGESSTPSYVSFTDEMVYVGQSAKEVTTFPQNKIFDFKRILGRRFDDLRDVQSGPFKIVDDAGFPKYAILRNGHAQLVSPEEVYGEQLKAMKITAEKFLGKNVQKAVITVPAYFNERQREATRSAGRLAGLEVIAVLNEPTAAAIAFGLDKRRRNQTVLIFDLGKCSLDASVLHITKDGSFDIKACRGDIHLGGQDIDSLLLAYVIEDIWSTFGIVLRVDDDPELLHELRKACELAKRKLSSLPQTTMCVFLEKHGKHYSKNVSKAFIEGLCMQTFKAAIDILPEVLKQAKVTKEEVDEVVLIGGSTRIPKVRSMVQDFFNGKELNKLVNPVEAVARGAALHAAELTAEASARQVVKKDVSSLTLGMATLSGVDVLILRNTLLPCAVTRTFAMTSDQHGTAEISIKLCQGERARWEDNHVLGDFTVSVPVRAQGKMHVDVTFALDTSGVLTVTAVERSSQWKASVELQCESRLSEDMLRKILEKAKCYSAD